MSKKSWVLNGSFYTETFFPETTAMDILDRIDVPTLILTPEFDFPEFAEIASYLEENIKDSKKIIIKDTAHMVNMENPEEFNRHVLGFLKK